MISKDLEFDRKTKHRVEIVINKKNGKISVSQTFVDGEAFMRTWKASSSIKN